MRSSRPSPLTSSMCPLLCASVAPFGPNSTLRGSTVVASNVSVARMTTGMTPLLLGLMLFEDSLGLMSSRTVMTPPAGARVNCVTNPAVFGLPSAPLTSPLLSIQEIGSPLALWASKGMKDGSDRTSLYYEDGDLTPAGIAYQKGPTMPASNADVPPQI